MDKVLIAANTLRNGGIVIFPSDTVFGIGCRVGDPAAIRKLYKIRNRPEEKPSLILAESIKQVEIYAYLTKEAKILAERFWPGPLTMILKAKKEVSKLVLGEDNSIGIRVPNLPYLKNLIKQVGEPILAPSANFTGKRPPKIFSEIDRNLTELVDYVLKIDCGSGKPSTVVRMIGSNHKILREGAIKSDQILHKKGV